MEPGAGRRPTGTGAFRPGERRESSGPGPERSGAEPSRTVRPRSGRPAACASASPGGRPGRPEGRRMRPEGRRMRPEKRRARPEERRARPGPAASAAARNPAGPARRDLARWATGPAPAGSAAEPIAVVSAGGPILAGSAGAARPAASRPAGGPTVCPDRPTDRRPASRPTRWRRRRRYPGGATSGNASASAGTPAPRRSSARGRAPSTAPVRPRWARPRSARPGSARPGSARRGTVRPGRVRPEMGWPEMRRPGTARQRTLPPGRVRPPGLDLPAAGRPSVVLLPAPRRAPSARLERVCQRHRGARPPLAIQNGGQRGRCAERSGVVW